MKAKDIMVTTVPVISRKATVREAYLILKKNLVKEENLNTAPGLVVVDEKGNLAGILSPLTIIKALLDCAGTARCTEAEAAPTFYTELCTKVREKLVEDIMDWQAISVTEDADLLDVAELFVKHRFQRIPVVKNNGVVGVIYRSRVLFALATCLDG
jgi:CBS domain-containing protein